jgi:hypothetical protein
MLRTLEAVQWSTKANYQFNVVDPRVEFLHIIQGGAVWLPRADHVPVCAVSGGPR